MQYASETDLFSCVLKTFKPLFGDLCLVFWSAESEDNDVHQLASISYIQVVTAIMSIQVCVFASVSVLI